ncbi:MAG: cytochrome c peroxidase [Phycisphaerales bacterium JB043]
MRTLSFLVGAVLICAAHARAQERVPVLPATPLNYENIQLPAHYLVQTIPGPVQNAVVDNDNTPPANPITDEGATLGRVLFYDPLLSLNLSTSCSSCHTQETGFGDPNQLSIGFEGGLTRRHSMALSNARFYQRGRFFWDERAQSLEDQVLMPIQDSVEMGLTLAQLVNRVSRQEYYDQLFVDAFGDPTVTSDRIAQALAQFVRSMVSASSRYDQGRALVANPTQPFPNFTPQENQGKAMFLAAPLQGGLGCIACHSTEAFINAPPGPTNNGLGFDANDLGAFETFGTPGTVSTFKVPSLRNVAVRGRFMHDGRFSNLGEVIEHYNSGVENAPNLGPTLQNPDGTVRRLNLTQQQKDALVAFLGTLTDQQFLTDERYSDPFQLVEDVCVGDLFQDGQVDGVDLGALLSNWGNPGSTDLNNDGTTDGADLGLFLGQWGPC